MLSKFEFQNIDDQTETYNELEKIEHYEEEQLFKDLHDAKQKYI